MRHRNGQVRPSGPADVRCALVLGLLLLAGCADPGGGEPRRTCQWSEGPPGEVVRGGFFAHDPNDNHRADELGRDALENGGRPLAAMTLSFHPWQTPTGENQTQGVMVRDGRVTLRFERMDDGTPLQAYRDQRRGEPRDTWTFEQQFEKDFTLTVPFDAAGGGPSGVRAVWTFERNLDGNADTQSVAFIHYNVQRWYEECFDF